MIAWRMRPFVRSDPDSYVLSARMLHDSVWKESRGHADWVIMHSDRRTSLSSRWPQVVLAVGQVASHYDSPSTGVPDGRR